MQMIRILTSFFLWNARSMKSTVNVPGTRSVRKRAKIRIDGKRWLAPEQGSAFTAASAKMVMYEIIMAIAWRKIAVLEWNINFINQNIKNLNQLAMKVKKGLEKVMSEFVFIEFCLVQIILFHRFSLYNIQLIKRN